MTDGGADAGNVGDHDWPELSTRTEHENPWFAVRSTLVERPDGEAARYYWVDPGDAVAVVALTDDAEVVFVEQYRPRQRRVLRTLPAGGVEDGEASSAPDSRAAAGGREGSGAAAGGGEGYEAAAARELREETGFRAGDTELLATMTDCGWLRREYGIVAATELEPGPQDLDDGEFIDVTTVPAGEAVAAAREGRLFGPTLAGLALAREAGLL